MAVSLGDLRLGQLARRRVGLYNVAEDFSQAEDLADQYPEKLRELQDLFMAAAAKYNVFPLDRFAERLDVTLRPSFFAGRNKITFFFGFRRYDVVSPDPLMPGKHTIEVSITPESEKPGGRTSRANSFPDVLLAATHRPVVV